MTLTLYADIAGEEYVEEYETREQAERALEAHRKNPKCFSVSLWADPADEGDEESLGTLIRYWERKP